jgi:hypothetical protein
VISKVRWARGGLSDRTVRTGLCIVTSTPKAKTNHVLMSSSASRNCRTENEVLSPPSRSFAMRMDRTSFSRALRNQASFGPFGIRKKKATPEAAVIAPQTMKSTRQGARDRDVFLPMPYIRRQPITWARPFIVTHRLFYISTRLCGEVSRLTRSWWRARSSDTRSM